MYSWTYIFVYGRTALDSLQDLELSSYLLNGYQAFSPVEIR